jgi:hypothetical protein
MALQKRRHTVYLFICLFVQFPRCISCGFAVSIVWLLFVEGDELHKHNRCISADASWQSGRNFVSAAFGDVIAYIRGVKH